MFGFSRDSMFRETTNSKARALTPMGNHGWYKGEDAIMGTSISVELWSEDKAIAEEAIAAVMGEMHRIDRLMSPHKPDSELSVINRDAFNRPVPVCDEMMRLFLKAAHFSDLSHGTFDITFAAVGRLFDYRTRQRPNVQQLARAREAIGYQHFILNQTDQTVRFAKPEMAIDLGGFAKGHAVDNAARLLKQRGIVHANVSAGGDSRVIGDKRGRPWMIGVRDPRNAEQIVAMLPLIDTSISTSGDYERYFDEDGVRFHHLIDPATGKSPDRLRSVTILAEDGLTTEAFSKIVFISGIEKGLALLDAQNNIDAVIVDADGKLHYSSGLLNQQ